MNAAAKVKAYPKPVPYNLDDPAEVYRLLRECHGYLHTCRRDHHGTDLAGRQYAMDALETLAKGDWKIAIHPPETEMDAVQQKTPEELMSETGCDPHRDM